MKPWLVVADIGTKRDRYAEMALYRYVRLEDGQPSFATRTRVLHSLQLRWIKQAEALRYEEMTDSIIQLITRPELLDNCDLFIDGTGLGDAVAEMLRKKGAYPIPIVSTKGEGGRAHAVYADVERVFGEDRGQSLSGSTIKEWLVPRRDMISDLSIMLEQGRIEFSPKVNHLEALNAQLVGFRPNPRKGGKLEAESEELHDDLVIDLMMAAWVTRYFGNEIPEGELPETDSAVSWDPLARTDSPQEPLRDVPVTVQSWR